jgi:hypothetical protein
MKVCSICQRQYADSLKFCLEDGTVLTHAPELDATLVDPQATLRLNARETDPRPVALNHTKPLPWIAVAVVSIVVVIAVVGVAALLLVNSASNSATESTSNPTSAPAQSSTQTSTQGTTEEVLRANDAVGTSLLEGDTESLARLLADDYRYENDLNVKLYKQDVLTLIRTGNLSYEYLTTTDPKVEVSSDSAKAVLTGRARAKGQWNHEPFVNSYSYRNTYEKRDGRWQLVDGFARYK